MPRHATHQTLPDRHGEGRHRIQDITGLETALQEGISGPQGVTGAPGPAGAQGAPGSQGAPGAPGDTGPQGDAGPQGSVGPQGPQGGVGNQGAQGSSGAAGPQGPQGAAGASGTDGTNGAPGTQGPRGFQGFQGLQGPQGTAGAQGSQGHQGSAGTAVGFQGSYNTLGELTAAFPSGAVGGYLIGTGGSKLLYSYVGGTWTSLGPVTGPQGPAGAQGASGTQGASGINGVDGADADPLPIYVAPVPAPDAPVGSLWAPPDDSSLLERPLTLRELSDFIPTIPTLKRREIPNLSGVPGVLDVTAFGADPTGRYDSTDAFKAAIALFTGSTPNSVFGPFLTGTTLDYSKVWRMHKVIWIPPGDYIISDTIARRLKDAVWAAAYAHSPSTVPVDGRVINGLIFRGAGSHLVRIHLKDNCPGFMDANARKPMMLLGSSPALTITTYINADGTLKAGTTNKNIWDALRNGTKNLLKGGGTDGYDNVVEGVSFHIGRGNVGADGVAGVWNNGRGMRDVRIISPYSDVGVGIDLTTANNGPDMHESIEVRGFAHAVSAFGGYQSHFENCNFIGQGVSCVRNEDYMLMLMNVMMVPVNSGKAIDNRADGVITARQGLIDMRQSYASEPITNAGYLNLNIGFDGTTSVLGAPASGGGNIFDGAFDPTNTKLSTAELGWAYPEPIPDYNPGVDPSRVGYLTGVDLTGTVPINSALTALMADTNIDTVVLPCGRLLLQGAPIAPPNHIKHIDCNFAYIKRDSTMLLTSNSSNPLLVENYYHENLSPTLDGITHNGANTLVVRNAVGNYWITRNAGAGKLHLVNLGQMRFKIYGTEPFFVRQGNSEGSGTRCTVFNGANGVILTSKVEQDATYVEVIGGTTLMLNHFAHPSSTPSVPAVKATDARLQLVMVDSAFNPVQVYTNFVGLSDGGVVTNVPASTFPSLGLGHVAINYTVDLRA
jgi:hypothetical protein